MGDASSGAVGREEGPGTSASAHLGHLEAWRRRGRLEEREEDHGKTADSVLRHGAGCAGRRGGLRLPPPAPAWCANTGGLCVSHEGCLEPRVRELSSKAWAEVPAEPHSLGQAGSCQSTVRSGLSVLHPGRCPRPSWVTGLVGVLVPQGWWPGWESRVHPMVSEQLGSSPEPWRVTSGVIGRAGAPAASGSGCGARKVWWPRSFPTTSSECPVEETRGLCCGWS